MTYHIIIVCSFTVVLEYSCRSHELCRNASKKRQRESPHSHRRRPTKDALPTDSHCIAPPLFQKLNVMYLESFPTNKRVPVGNVKLNGRCCRQKWGASKRLHIAISTIKGLHIAKIMRRGNTGDRLYEKSISIKLYLAVFD